MKIKLDDNYYIEVKEIGTFDLVKRTWSEKNEEYNNKTIGYHTTLEQALKWYVHISLASQEKTVTINEFIELHKELLEETKRIARGEHEGV